MTIMVDWGLRDSLRGLQGWLLPPLLSLLLIPGHNSSLRQVLHCSAGSLQHQLFNDYSSKYHHTGEHEIRAGAGHSLSGWSIAFKREITDTETEIADTESFKIEIPDTKIKTGIRKESCNTLFFS